MATKKKDESEAVVLPTNLELWGKYYTPPKDATKPFTRGGGFRGTAIDPMWAIRCATEEWGPIGDRWGIVIDEAGFQLFDESHVLHIAHCHVFYPGPSGERATVPCIGQTWAMYPGKNGLVYDDECVKKSVTDALSKGLSWLGFGAGVHMGAFDGNKWADLPERATADTKPADARNKARAKGNTPPASKAGNGRGNGNGSSQLKSVALEIWNASPDVIYMASGQSGDERAAKMYLLSAVQAAANRLGIDAANPSREDLRTLEQEVAALVNTVAQENAADDVGVY